MIPAFRHFLPHRGILPSGCDPNLQVGRRSEAPAFLRTLRVPPLAFCRFATLHMVLWLSLAPALAQERPAAETQQTSKSAQRIDPAAFRFFASQISIPEANQAPAGVVQYGGFRFLFQIPRDWSISARPADHSLLLVPGESIQMVAENGRGFTQARSEPGVVLQLRFILGPSPAEDPDTLAKSLEDLATSSYPGQGLENPKPCYTDGREGVVYEIRRRTTAGRLTLAVAVIPFAGGHVIGELTTPPDAFPRYKAFLPRLLGTLSAEPWPARGSQSGAR